MRRVDIECEIIKMGYRPVRKDGVLILEDDYKSQEKNKNGVYVDNTDESFNFRRATVISTGEYVSGLNVGDRVLFHKAYGLPIGHGDDSFCRLLYVTANQIECLIEEEDVSIV